MVCMTCRIRVTEKKDNVEGDDEADGDAMDPVLLLMDCSGPCKGNPAGVVGGAGVTSCSMV